MTDVRPKVWVSPNTNEELRLDESAAPVGWQAVGTIDSTRETELWKVVTGYLGLRSSSEPRSVNFWLDGEPSSEWVQQAVPGDPHGFRLAIDPAPTYRFFLEASQPAYLGHPSTREPEAHPALPKPQFVGIHLGSATNGLFQRVDI
jgi:hypothetical protein